MQLYLLAIDYSVQYSWMFFMEALEFDSDWIRNSKISSSSWQSVKGRWAMPQHHTCTYMAMFPPELPNYFIQRFTSPGDVVLDPFSGRGTTPVQACALGRYGIGNDYNDLAYILTLGKLANPSLEDVLQRLSELCDSYRREEWLYFTGVPRKIRMIFHPETTRQLLYLQRELDWRNSPVDSFIGMILMGAMNGASKGFLSLSMPNTFSMGWNYVKKYIDKNGLKRPNRDVFPILEERCRKTLKYGKLAKNGRAILGDVRKISQNVENGSVDMVFTSPPYLKVIKYGLYNWIRLWWLIGSHESIDAKLDDEHRLENYLKFIEEVLRETMLVLNPNHGIACFVIGDVKQLRTAEVVWTDVASNFAGVDANGNFKKFRLLEIVEDKIPDSQKVTKLWKSEDDKSGKATPTDRILILCHEDANPRILKNHKEVAYERRIK